LKPPYGPWQQTAELDFSGVYRLDPKTGQVILLTRELKYPNGIAFSPDETKLYLNDSATGKIMVFEMTQNRLLKNGRELANLSVAN
jgi:gluconolactonase